MNRWNTSTPNYSQVNIIQSCILTLRWVLSLQKKHAIFCSPSIDLIKCMWSIHISEPTRSTIAEWGIFRFEIVPNGEVGNVWNQRLISFSFLVSLWDMPSTLYQPHPTVSLQQSQTAALTTICFIYFHFLTRQLLHQPRGKFQWQLVILQQPLVVHYAKQIEKKLLRFFVIAYN